ncbi:hypothetical protein Nmel_001690 [Mimus melanotis]
MSKQQKLNTHGQPREWQSLLYKRHGPGTRQGHRPTPVQYTRSAPLCTGTQPAWRHLGHSETEHLITLQGGHGANTCSDLFRELGPYLRENRPVESTWRTSKWLSPRPRWEGIRLPSQQTARRKWQCPRDEEAVMQCLRKMREEQEELEDKFYDVMFRAIISSVENKESPLSSRCIPRDPPSPTLEPAAGPSKQHSACSVTKDAAVEAPKHSELVSLDQSLVELGPASDDSLSCDVLLQELLQNWDQEELPKREAARDRISESQRALILPQHDKEGCVLRDGSRVTPELAAGSQGPHSTSGATKDSAGEAEINAEMAPPDLLAHLCSASGNSPACNALLNELLEKWEEEELQDRAAAGERDSEPESVLSLPLQEEQKETAPSPTDNSPCDNRHSKAPLTTQPEEAKTFEVFSSSPANAADKNHPAWMQAGCAQAAPPQEEPCGAGALAGACPVLAQALARSVPAGPAGSAAVLQPPAPRPWRSMAKTARRALRRLFSFSCLRGQPEE